ncbi:MAG: cytochrome oxidase subunit [Ferruginibacter sp.]|nr:cytochrome oxidase subunit [Ferruginibacter sp.]
MLPAANNRLVKNTSYKVVLPFYIYAALAFLLGCILLFTASGAFTQHYFHPKILAITHTMALGWGTMMILGAGHQLLPVLIEEQLFSNVLAYLSFVFAAAGIPLLIYAFYTFNMHWPAEVGGTLVNAGVLCYLVNLAIGMSKSKQENVHAVFVFTATLWLLLTTAVGLFLVCNFTRSILPMSSVQYLSLHAHLGIVGWFLLMVIGVGSRLIPMFLISKFTNTKRLWSIYWLINIGLVSFIIIYIYLHTIRLYLLPVIAIIAALILFAHYCKNAYKQRIRRNVDEQMKVSLLSVWMMAMPLAILLITIVLLINNKENTQLVLLYGFSIFFGWITAIIFGMTFKTLPFIVWNKVYYDKAGLGKTPNPKDLYSNRLFSAMAIAYLGGFILFSAGIVFSSGVILKSASAFLLLAAVLYNWNVFKLVLHKPNMA